MSVIRAFIAIELPAPILKCLDKVTLDLKQQLEKVPIRWVPAENIHLTLKFLGDVSEANLEVLKKILKSIGSNHHAFEISVGGLGAFPKAQYARVIWVGLEIPPELIALHHSLEIETGRLGYAREERPFSPHLTIGRVSRNPTAVNLNKLSDVLKSYKVGFLGVIQVQAIHLFRSDLQPSGAVYTKMFTGPFQTG
jgi:2'-5' RNA ligase